MAHLYSFMDVVNGLENKIKSLEEVIIRISVQTTDCVSVPRIRMYAAPSFVGCVTSFYVKQPNCLGRLARQVISNTSQTISDLSEALNMKKHSHPGVTPHAAFVSTQTFRDVKRLGTTYLSCPTLTLGCLG